MRVLVVNCGSSTLKFQLIDTAKEDAAPTSERDLAHGVIERIGSQASLDFQAGSNAYRDTAAIADHEEATRRMFAWLDTAGFLAPGGLDAVGHRVVHGGPHFVAPTRLDDDVIAALTQLRELAPLHNEPAQAAIRLHRPCWVPVCLWSLCLTRPFITPCQHGLRSTPSRVVWPRDITCVATVFTV